MKPDREAQTMTNDTHTPSEHKTYCFERASERPYYISCCAPTINKFVSLDDYKAIEQQCDELQRELTKMTNKLSASNELYERALDLKRKAEQRHDEIYAAVFNYANSWLLDERNSVENCLCETHYLDVQALFKAIAKAGAQ